MALSTFFRSPLLIVALLIAAITCPLPVSAQAPAAPGAADTKAAAKPAAPPAPVVAPITKDADISAAALAIREERLKQMIGELEEKFRTLAKALEEKEPAQAKRLIEALNKSKEKLLAKRVENITELLKKEDFDQAKKEQEAILVELQGLVKILTEDPNDLEKKLEEIKRLEEFKKAVEKIIKDETRQLEENKKVTDPESATKDLDKQIASVQKLIEAQESVIKNTGSAREKGPHELGKIAGQQKDVREQTEKLHKEIGAKAEGNEAKPGEQGGKPGEQGGKPGEQGGKPGEQGGKPGEQGGKPGEQGGKPGEQGGKPGEQGGKPGESGGKPGESGGKPGESGGKPGESGGKPGESGGKAGESGGDQPGQEPLAKAAQNQKAAEQDLGDGKGKAAEKNEKEALANLQKALDDLKKERDRIAKLPPEHTEKMAQAQEKTADETGDLSKKMKESKSSSGGQGGQGGEGGEGESGEGEPTPGQEQVQQAQQQMQQAAKKLGDKQPKSAQKPQKDSIDKLKQAREEIEKRLAQLRKDMQEELLAALEARFREMLEKQKPITIETASLEGIRKQREWKRTEKLTCANLGKEEKLLGDLADVALQIIKEDGTTVVFPRIVERLRDDFFAVSERLKAEQTDGFTQDMQKEIERTLQELIEALQRAQDVKENSPPGQPGQPGQPQQPPLVPESAELKLIKAAQMRVNRLTNSFDKNRPAELKPTDQKAINGIARQQQDVQKMADDIVEKK